MSSVYDNVFRQLGHFLVTHTVTYKMFVASQHQAIVIVSECAALWAGQRRPETNIKIRNIPLAKHLSCKPANYSICTESSWIFHRDSVSHLVQKNECFPIHVMNTLMIFTDRLEIRYARPPWKMLNYYRSLVDNAGNVPGMLVEKYMLDAIRSYKTFLLNKVQLPFYQLM